MSKFVETIIDDNYFKRSEYSIDGNLRILNNASFGTIEVFGSLTVEGNLICNKNIIVHGDLFVKKNVSLCDAKIYGNFFVDGIVSMDGDLYVKNDCKFKVFNPKSINVFIGGTLNAELGLSSRIHHISIGTTIDF